MLKYWVIKGGPARRVSWEKIVSLNGGIHGPLLASSAGNIPYQIRRLNQRMQGTGHVGLLVHAVLSVILPSFMMSTTKCKEEPSSFFLQMSYVNTYFLEFFYLDNNPWLLRLYCRNKRMRCPNLKRTVFISHLSCMLSESLGVEVIVVTHVLWLM